MLYGGEHNYMINLSVILTNLNISLKASENGKQLTSGRGATVTEAVYKYEYMVSCDLPTSRKGDQQTNPVMVMTYHCHMMVLIMETLLLL